MSPVEVAFLAPALVAEVYCLVKASRFIALLLERMANRLEDEQAWRQEWRPGAGWTKPTAQPRPAREFPGAGMPERPGVGRNKTP